MRLCPLFHFRIYCSFLCDCLTSKCFEFFLDNLCFFLFLLTVCPSLSMFLNLAGALSVPQVKMKAGGSVTAMGRYEIRKQQGGDWWESKVECCK